MTQAANDKYLNILFPTGRLVSSNLYEPRTTDHLGNPLVYKTGKNAGQPKVDYSVGIAFPKTQAQWHLEPWGQQIHQFAYQVWGNTIQRPDFAWKIIDGDSAIPNKANRMPKDQEGYPGHWVIFFGRNTPPKIVNSDGSQYLLEPGTVKCGYYVQVQASLCSNESTQTPGLHYNQNAVSLQGYGQEIVRGPDPSQMGFGKSPLPAGASSVPIGAMTPPGAAAPAPMGVPAGAPAPMALPPASAPAPMALPAGVPVQAALAGVPIPGAAAPALMALPPASAPAPITPNPAFVQNAMVPPGAMPQLAPPAAPQMGPAARGFTYEQWKAQGYDDATLRANGVII